MVILKHFRNLDNILMFKNKLKYNAMYKKIDIITKLKYNLRCYCSNNSRYEERIRNASKSLKSSFRNRGGISVTDRLNNMIPDDDDETVNHIKSTSFSEPNLKNSKYFDYDKAKPFAKGELIKTTFRYKKYDHVKLFQLKPGDSIKRYNVEIDHSQFIGKFEHETIYIDDSLFIKMARPSLAEFTQHWRRGVVTPSTKVVLSALSNSGLSREDSVLEAGSGQGMVSLLLSKYVGDTGRVHSFDISSEQTVVARQHFDAWRTSYATYAAMSAQGSKVVWPDNVDFNTANLTDYAAADNLYDMVYLDMPNPSSVFENAVNLVKPGKCIMVYSPSCSHVEALLKLISRRGIYVSFEDVWHEYECHWNLANKYDNLNCDWLQNNRLSFPSKDATLSSFIMRFRKINPLPYDKNVQRPSSYWFSIAEQRPSLLDSMRTKLGEAFSNRREKSSLNTHEGATSSENNHTINDGLMIRSIKQPKYNEKLNVLRGLESNAIFSNSWGSITHNSIIGQSNGQILEMSKGNYVYASQLSMIDYLNITFQTNVITPRCVFSALGLSSMTSGSKVVTICNNHVSPVFQLIVDSIIGKEGESKLLITNEIKSSRIINDWFKTNQSSVSNLKTNTTLQEFNGIVPENFKNKFDNAIVCCMKSDSPVRYMDAVLECLSFNGGVTILTDCFTDVVDMVQYGHANSTSLELQEILQDCEDKWLVRPIANQISDRNDENYAIDHDRTYVCRPLPHKISQPKQTVFMMQIKKILPPKEIKL